MNVLLVFAHPNPKSFNGAMRDAIVAEVKQLGHSIEVSDLYAEDFDPRGGPADVTVRANPDTFHYQTEQTAAAKNSTFAPDLAREQARLKRADILILQFPIWWGGAPAILKGWFDRVAAYGVAYADGTRYGTGLFKGRRAMVSVTTGGTPKRFSDGEGGTYGPIEQVLRPVQQLFLGYLGYTVVPPHVAYAVARVGDAERKASLESLRGRVRDLLATPVQAEPVPTSQELFARLGNRDWRHPG